METKQNKKQKSIIETAIGLFLKYTVKKTSMDDIASAAGASKVTVYKYFGDKEGLYFSAYEHISSRFETEIAERMNEATATLAQKMTGFISVYTLFVSSGHHDLCLQLSGLSANVREGFASLQRKNEDVIKHLIEQAKAKSLMQAGTHDDVLFHYIDMGLSYFLHDERFRSRIQSDERFREEFMSLVMRNIFTDEQQLN